MTSVAVLKMTETIDRYGELNRLSFSEFRLIFILKPVKIARISYLSISTNLALS